jgi:hypothetical protein
MPTPAVYDMLYSFKDIHKVVLDPAKAWGFSEGLHQSVGTDLSYEAVATLPIPKKDELLGYLRNAYEAMECLKRL